MDLQQDFCNISRFRAIFGIVGSFNRLHTVNRRATYDFSIIYLQYLSRLSFSWLLRYPFQSFSFLALSAWAGLVILGLESVMCVCDGHDCVMQAVTRRLCITSDFHKAHCPVYTDTTEIQLPMTVAQGRGCGRAMHADAGAEARRHAAMQWSPAHAAHRISGSTWQSKAGPLHMSEPELTADVDLFRIIHCTKS